MTEILEKEQKVESKKDNIKVCAISDLHGTLPKIDPCDLVLICGDLVGLNVQSIKNLSKRWYLEIFNKWIDELDCDKVLFIAGNHDFFLNKNVTWVKDYFNENNKATYLENEYYNYKGLKIFGTPYCKIFGNWQFMYSNSALRMLFEEIPNDLDILITHDAPYGCSDILLDYNCIEEEHIGNVPLREAIIRAQPKYNLHGHLHSTNHGEELLENTKVYNCSILNENYVQVYQPLYLDF